MNPSYSGSSGIESKGNGIYVSKSNANGASTLIGSISSARVGCEKMPKGKASAAATSSWLKVWEEIAMERGENCVVMGCLTGFVSVKQRGESRDVDQQVVAVLGPSHWLVLRKRSPVWALGDRWSNPKEVINREKFDLMVDN